MSSRYAIYYAPESGTAWSDFGTHWLGAEPWRIGRPVRSDWPLLEASEQERVTAEPRRYGFHATLKAPFRLHAAGNPNVLLARVTALARTLHPLPLGTLVPVYTAGFVALVPSTVNPALTALAQACVTELDDLRAPLTAADLARRRPDQLDPRGRELLARFGYPHVLERYRFHMTLTGPVDTALAGRIVAHLARPMAQLNAQSPPILDRLCIFEETQPGLPLRRMAQVELSR